MTQITMTGTYFCRGDTERKYPVRVLCVDGRNPKYPVVAEFFNGSFWVSENFTLTGGMCIGEASEFDLIEHNPWADVPVDTPVWVRDKSGAWCARHFAEYKDGRVWAWEAGCTSHTANGGALWWNEASITKPEGA